MHKPADPDASRAADLFDTEVGKLNLCGCGVVREIGVREHRANSGEARRLAPNRPGESKLTVERAAEHLQADAIRAAPARQ